MMSDAHDAPRAPEPISQELDDLTCSLIDYALDILATSGELSVSLAVADKAGKATLLTFDDDDFEESIEEARARVRAAYTAVLRREKKPDASRTARETLLSGASTGKSDAAQLCGSYERARYSDHPITDAEAENARRAL